MENNIYDLYDLKPENDDGNIEEENYEDEHNMITDELPIIMVSKTKELLVMKTKSNKEVLQS